MVDGFPAFQPHRLLRNNHLQTLAGTMFQSRRTPYRAVPHRIHLPDGDMTILHDDRPAGWQPTSPTTLLIHGLAGCHRSSYMVLAAKRLNEAGVRTFRMDMRACGAAEGLARMPYHGGCTHDLFVALERVAKICPASPMSLVGYSIGGNVALKLAAEAADYLPRQLSRMVVISPPIDLEVCVDRLSQGAGYIYDRYLGITHCRQLRRSLALVEHAPQIVDALRPRGQRDFDDRYTSTVWGFGSVKQFYTETSSCHTISDVRIPTLLIASRDDPLVPVELFEPLKSQNSITIHLTDHGGHLGFIGRSRSDPDRRWLDWRIVDAVTAGRTSSAAEVA